MVNDGDVVWVVAGWFVRSNLKWVVIILNGALVLDQKLWVGVFWV